MSVRSPHDVTQLLQRTMVGDEEALASLMPLVYDELRRVAGRHLLRERRGRTLQTTDLVHEAFLRLVPGTAGHRPQNRAHFFAIAARAMREILIDRARARAAAKRGGARLRVTLSDVAARPAEISEDVLALEEALVRLARLDPRQARIVELRYFAGASIEEMSEALRVSPATVKRDWAAARAWLRRELSRSAQ